MKSKMIREDSMHACRYSYVHCNALMVVQCHCLSVSVIQQFIILQLMVSLMKCSTQVDDSVDSRLDDEDVCQLENFVHPMMAKQEVAEREPGSFFTAPLTSVAMKPDMVGDIEDMFDLNERLSSPEYERYRSFRRLSVLDEVGSVCNHH